MDRLPTELREEILLHLPIDGSLCEVSLASKVVGQSVLQATSSFARKHVQLAVQREQHADCLPSFLSLRVGDALSNTWAALPLAYRVVICAQALQVDHCPHHPPQRYVRTWNPHRHNALTTVNLLLALPWFTPTWKLLFWTATNGLSDAMTLVLSLPEIDPCVLENEVMAEAILSGHPDIVRILLKDGRLDPSYQQNRPLRFATTRNNPEIVEILLKDPRVDPRNSDDNCHDGSLLLVQRVMQTVYQTVHVDESVGLFLTDLFLKDGRCEPAPLGILEETRNALVAALTLPAGTKRQWSLVHAIMKSPKLAERAKDFGIVVEFYDAGRIDLVRSLFLYYSIYSGTLFGRNVFPDPDAPWLLFENFLLFLQGNVQGETVIYERIERVCREAGILSMFTNQGEVLRCNLMNWELLNDPQ